MVNNENEICAGQQQVIWIGSHKPNTFVKSLEHKNVYYYKKCVYGPLTLTIGDYILVANADAAEPDTVEGCDIAKILHLYELREMSHKESCRAIVQWYSRPQAIPHKNFDVDDLNIDFDREIIEEHRPYDNDVALGSIFRKCLVIEGSSQSSAEQLFQRAKAKPNCPMFVTRYKFVKVKQSYRLIPLEIQLDDKPRSGRDGGTTSTSARKSISRRRLSTTAAGNAPPEFVDVNYFNCENKVSPIKIVGGCSVVRLSEKKKSSLTAATNNDDPAEINANYLMASPLTEKNAKVSTPKSRASAARRNLNLSLDKGADTTADSDCLNYSIVQQTPDPKTPSNDMKIKLRLSERRKSARLVSIDDERDPLDTRTSQSRKRLGVSTGDIYHTPTKKSKELLESAGQELTPSTRRKSILKSATTRLADGTPRRSIQLSNIVEQRIFDNNEIISTPKRNRSKLADPVNPDPEYTPKKSSQKTPTRPRRMSSTGTKVATASKLKDEAAPLTPSQKLKKIRAGELSPSLEQRHQPLDDRAKSQLQLAREQLHVSVVPKSLPCREKEFDNIYSFLEGKIQDQCGGCMYVSGVPGTGKTATVTGVIRSLQRLVTADKLPAFDFLEINGMRLTEPRQAYVQIYKQLTGKTVSWEHAHSLLEKRFTTPALRRVTTVLLVDELDILCNRRQDVVYNLLDWPTKSAARLVVITIANTMDLPERLLMGKVTSRLGLTRLTFQPYTHKQLQEIVTARLAGSEAFKGEAVQLVARKVAAVSGDARRALDICRRATEIADTVEDQPAAKCVNMLHVQQALAEMIASAKVQAIKNCSRLEQIFLQAVAAEVTRTGVEETTFLGVYMQVESIAAFMGVSLPAPGRALHICSKLGAERLIICEHSRNDLYQKILLNVSADDIHYALRVEGN
ncbi:origin recognition complex subunit 1 [Drosophila innubila]|uniref:origin recognition complex subunit 1 n=1 Tax=Drosophila innubila TaxID=198719 RepID=UPI00148C3276|nr:origin recognition complex subunit 1 [Drosophila innubila]